ncbi:serine hydrolase domain-containing protein [Diaphorobacter aerolatus]|uniref:Beta-lactamase family protein n=1 Tax=Diaphorobacter aerolatus TaxID=1288495 RepID=A0A7H0GM24_9BURK|nr:serine hydrolase domain-containing protein [Diaphorobacter aerolatus]QNP49340.1 beta-lactamase family protein [Diaphorobacter aerolatus]
MSFFNSFRVLSLAVGVTLLAAVSLPAAEGRTASASSVQTNAKLARHLTPVLQAAVNERRIVGGVAVVAVDGKILYRQAVGLADRESGRLMRPETDFRLASMTKPLVTVVAMRLIESGQLGLDDAVTRYLPDFRPRLVDGTEPVIRVRHLMTHTSGLGYRFLEAEDGAYARLKVSDGLDDAAIRLDENLRRLGQAPLYFEPGKGWRYSLGIDVLGAVIEKVTGGSLSEAVAQYVTRPLSLTHTRFVARAGEALATPYADGKPAPIRMTRNMAVPLPGDSVGALRFDPGRAFNAQAFASGGAGALGNADDFMVFLETIRTGGAPLLNAQSSALMMKDQVGEQAQTQGPGWGFGYGWAVLVNPALARSPQSKGTLQWGGAYGHNWFVDPERKLTVVLLTNTAFEGMSGALVTQVRDAVYAGLAP